MSRLATLTTLGCFLAIPHAVSVQPLTDMNFSGRVDFLDYSLFQSEFGWTGVPGASPADFDVDGVVGLLDFRELWEDLIVPCQMCTSPVLCEDLNVCTNDDCVTGCCQHTDRPGCCTTDADCDDSDSCTQDLCIALGCVNSPVCQCVSDDECLDDGIGCTKEECICSLCARQYECKFQACSGADPFNRPPVAVIKLGQSCGVAPLIVTFEGRLSFDVDGDPITFKWQFRFSDGQIQTASTGIVVKAFIDPGVYTAELEVVDTGGCIGRTGPVVVIVMPP